MIALAQAAGSTVLLMAACIGAGGLLLALLKILPELSPAERIAWSFPVGFIWLGWILFFPAFAGVLTSPLIFAVCAVSALMSVAFRSAGNSGAIRTATAGDASPLALGLLLAGTALVLGVDLMEALSPPADGDTLTYHFDLPKRYLQTGGLIFVPRAVEGSPPQLIQMTYTAALALGGEKGLTLWTMASGWMTAVLIYVVARRWLPCGWSFALSLIYLSTPTVLLAGGTGHVEPRIAQFVLLGAIACATALHTKGVRYAALGGLCAGGFAASKYTGLVFGACCLLVLLLSPGRVRRVLAFATLGGIFAFQWYLWIWLNTGDPLFPMLYRYLGTSDPALWSDVQQAVFEAWGPPQRILDPSIWSFFVYPFFVTFIYDPVIDNSRTGLGIFAFLALPFAVGYLFSARRSSLHHPLFLSALIVLLFYALWFFLGTPQRVRHLLPVFPVVLLVLTVAAVRFAAIRDLRAPLVGAAAITIVLQLGGQAFFGLNYARHLFTGESRDAFLQRNVYNFGLVPWINAHLTASDRVLTTERQLLYHFDHRAVLSDPNFRADLNFETKADQPGRLFAEMRRAGITHVIDTGEGTGAADTVLPRRIALRKMLAAGCIALVHRAHGYPLRSRTLDWRTSSGYPLLLFAVTPDTCRLDPNDKPPAPKNLPAGK